MKYSIFRKALFVKAYSQIIIAKGVTRLYLKSLSIISDGFVDLSDFIECKASVENSFKVMRIKLYRFIVVLNGFFKLLFLTSFPSVRVQQVSLPQRIFS